jgi:hypothetical protein
MSQGVTTAATTNTSNGTDLSAYQSYFSSFATTLNTDQEKRKTPIHSCTHCQKVIISNRIQETLIRSLGTFNLRWR